MFPENTGLSVKLFISSKPGRESRAARITATINDGIYRISIYGEPIIKK